MGKKSKRRRRGRGKGTEERNKLFYTWETSTHLANRPQSRSGSVWPPWDLLALSQLPNINRVDRMERRPRPVHGYLLLSKIDPDRLSISPSLLLLLCLVRVVDSRDRNSFRKQCLLFSREVKARSFSRDEILEKFWKWIDKIPLQIS